MTRKSETASLCRSRLLRLQERARLDIREKLDKLDGSTDSNIERPFMIPRGHDPFDIWQHILDKVTDAQDVLALWDVCPLFREILSLKPRKGIQARLSQIIDIILDKHPRFLLNNEVGAVNGGVQNIDTTSLWRTIFVNLRKTSRLCKTSAERLLESKDSRNLRMKFDTVRKLQNVIDGILGEEILADSFLFGYVEVSERRNGAGHRRFFAKISIFLELVGERVRKFSYVSMEEPQGVYDKLSEWMLYMPNLEHLELTTEYGRSDLRRRGVAIPDLKDVPIFPKCHQLRSFTQVYKKLPAVYLRRIIEASPLIRTFAIEGIIYQNQFEEFIQASLMNRHFQHLEHLKTPMYPRLVHCHKLRMPLKQIIFNNQESWQGLPVVSNRVVFPFLNQFKETLEHLEIGARLTCSEDCLLDLPRLKVFKWKYDRSFKNMDFLSLAERLESVEMKVDDWISDPELFSDRFFKRATKGFNGFTMWQVFPALKKLELEIRVRFFPAQPKMITLRRYDPV